MQNPVDKSIDMNKGMPLPSEAQLLTANPWKLQEIWDQIKGYDSIFGNDYMRSQVTYMDQFLQPDTVVIELDGGIILLTHIIQGLRCEVHMIFWDHKLSARQELLNELLIWAFITFDLYRIETFVASYARSVMRFIEKKMGFTYEGTMRNRIIHRGLPTNLKVYSILREEVLDGS